MERKEGRYELYVGDVWDDSEWGEKGIIRKLERAGNMSCTGLRSNNRSKLKQIINILDLKAWEIKDHKRGSFGEVVEESKLVKETNDRARQKREKADKARRNRAKEINSLPDRYLLWDYDGNDDFLGRELGKTRLELRRTEANYKPRVSSNVLYDLSVVVIVDGVEQDRTFYLNNFVTENGKIQQKKFDRDCFRGMKRDSPEKQRLNKDLRQVVTVWKRVKRNIRDGVVDKAGIV